MKILAIAPERSDAQAAASAFESSTPDVVVACASRLEDGAHWIFNNLDVAALIVDAQLGTAPCASFFTNLRRRGLATPAIVVATDATDVSIESLGLGADDCILHGHTLLRELPPAVIRAVDRFRLPATHDVFAQKLAAAQRALEREERMRAMDAAVAAAQLARHCEELSARCERAQQDCASNDVIIAGLVHRESELSSALATATLRCNALEHRLADANRSLADADVHEQRVAALQRQLDEIRTDADRQFEEHPLPLCRSTRDGVFTHANRAFAALVGDPTADAKRRVDLATGLFGSSHELSWLVERSVTTGAACSIECPPRSVDGCRLIVRASALASADAIHLVVEDITSNWTLQDRLSRAQRMEAVGRLAAEVSLTCGNLLGDVIRDGQRWLATLDDDPALRQSGERMLNEVTRAASFLQQLAEYGDDQANALEPVDLHQVLHDLRPILQELAGDDIQLVLPTRALRKAPPFNVDLNVERVEQLLINVAGFSRERMPSGGKMIFELAPTLVDRQFIEKHPNVRQGPHVLLTVTEARSAVPSNGPLGLRERFAQVNDPTSPSEKPGVDLGALQGLVRGCGGHLWMEAEPPGDLRIKIHLPLRAA